MVSKTVFLARSECSLCHCSSILYKSCASFTMEHKRKLPEDGCLKPITDSKISLSCNIMIIKVPDEMKGPGEMTYQLATYDRTIEGIDWPANKYVDKIIPNLPKVNAPKQTRSELKKAPSDYVSKYREASIKFLSREEVNRFDEKTDNNLGKKFQSHKNQVEMEKKSPIDVDPWENPPFYSGINPYRPINNNTYKNNYNENPRSERVSDNLYINNRVNWNKRSRPWKNRVPNAPRPFVPSSKKGSCINDPAPNAMSSTFFDNFSNYPRRNQSNFLGKNHDFNFNRNHRFRNRNNEFESGNCEEISNHDISSNFYEDMPVRSDNLYERMDGNSAGTSAFIAPFTNEQFKKKRSEISVNTYESTAPHNITPVRFKNNHAPFMNSKTPKMSSSRESYNHDFKRQNRFPGRYNNRGRYMRGRRNY
ncbi:uncharacterized protein NPIL_206421 [Nephila pilipes]|uniref:Uncharacterized protein n=1 Tax=Nephila pilipes TaxID=299642 RepID=A0A8X6UHX4_NEPPI|nr:uncharacterized protein NPIL_206421 [Nephila pilipes]